MGCLPDSLCAGSGASASDVGSFSCPASILEGEETVAADSAALLPRLSGAEVLLLEETSELSSALASTLADLWSMPHQIILV